MKKLIFALLLLAFQNVGADTLSGRVVGVADGDTVTVLDQKHEQHKVRLSGIDAPEKSQPFGYPFCGKSFLTAPHLSCVLAFRRSKRFALP